MGNYQHINEFKVRYCDVDFRDQLKPSAMLAYLEEVACSSADELGFGYQYVKPRNMAFMVTNLQCRFYRPVPLGELMKVVTWPLPPTYATFGREYQIYLQSGEKAMDASARWCLVDVTAGRLLQSKHIEGQDYSTYNTTRALVVENWKIPAFSIEGEKESFQMVVRNSEYDHNQHVNNTKYADYCFNCFSLAELKERKLCAFAINYVRQCHENDTLRFYRKHLEEEKYLVQGVSENGEIVVQAKIEFSF